MKLIYLLFLLLILFISCDKVESPFVENTITTPVLKDSSAIDTSAIGIVNHKIIIEDFTGQKCTNCPRAHEVIKDLSAVYSGKIIPVAIHCGYYSVPNSSGIKYKYDFRTDAGNEMEAFYQIPQYPFGLVNSLAKEELVSDGVWGTKVASFVNLPSKLKIVISNTHNEVSHYVTIKIKTTALNDLNNNLYLVVFLTEDSIRNWQTVLSVDSANYLHRHVLRKVLTNSFGDLMNNGIFKTRYFIEKKYSFSYPSGWNSKNLSIVAYVYDFATKGILQAEQKKIDN